MARILVVEDESHVAELIALGLERQGYEVRVADEGPLALNIAAHWEPDLVTLCVSLPTMDGFEVCRRLRALPQTCQCLILFLSARTLPEDRLAAFEAGGDDYLTKPFEFSELIWRVRALLRRYEPSEPEYLRVGLLILNCDTRELQVGDRTQLLTRVEFDLLSHLTRHPGQFFSNDQLLQAVWGYPPGVGSPALVRAHTHNLRRRIERDPDNPTLLQTVRGRGHTLRPA